MAFDPNSTNNVTVRRFYSVMSSLWAKIKAAIPLASSTTPSMDGTADAGSETTWARGDHVHPTDTSRAPTSHASSGTTYGIGTTSNYGHVKLATGDMNGATNVDGVAVSKNHTHSQYVPTTRKVNGQALSADVTVATPGTLKTNATTAQTASSGEAMSGTITLHKVSKTGTYSDLIGKPTIPGGSSTTPLMDGTAAVGTETSWAHGDHVHPTDTSREAASNKKTSINVSSNTDFPTSKAVADFVNSSIATATAEFLGTYDVVADLGLTTSATNAQISTALGTHTWPSGVTPTNQDYVFVSVDDPGTTTDSAEYRRFKYNGTAWIYEYTLNNSSFTQAQWDAINSGVTATFVQNAVTGVKGGNESTYRTGQVNITKANIGLGNVANTNITVSATAGVKDVTNNVTYKYTHPTFTAVSAAAKKVGMNSEGHVVLGDALTKGDVGLGNVVNTGDSATPAEGGTDKFTTGGAYTELAKKADNENAVYYVVGSCYAAYSSSKTYTQTTNTGPFDDTNSCVYSSQPYYCTTTISTGEAWNSNHWAKIPTAVWTGTNSAITSLYAGLKIAIKVPSYGGTSATQININGLGAKTMLRNTSNYTSHLPTNSIVFLAYDGTYWRWADYNSDSWVTTIGAYCETDAGTAAKAASSSNTVLTAGMAFLTRFTNTNSYSGKLTLNVNSTGAKDLWLNGAVSSSSNCTLAKGEYWTYYDGTKFCIWTDGSVQLKGLHLDTPLADTEIASAATWNAKEDASNKVSAWSETTTDVHYPSEKLVKTDLDNRIDRYDAVYNRNNIDGDGWVKLADVTFSRTSQVDKPFIWDVAISRCTGSTSSEQLTLNVCYNTSGLPNVYFNRYYTVNRTSTHKFAVVTCEQGGLMSGANGKVELWAYLEKFWGSIGIREIAGSQSTALYGQKKVIANYYSYTDEGGTTKPVADLENYVQVIDSTNIQLASSSDVSTAITNAINGLDAAVTSSDGTNVQVKVTEANGKITAVNVTTDNTENRNNKVTSWSSTTTNTNYPSEKLVKDSLDGKADKVSNATSGHLAGLDANGNLTDSGKAVSDLADVHHGHGNILEDGSILSNGASQAALSNGCSLVYTDQTNKIKKTSITFDAISDHKALTQKGTFETFTKVESSSTNGKIKIDGTDTTVYTHPAHTAYTSKGSATKVPQITTDALGHVTSISEVTISGVTPASHSHGSITNDGKIGSTANLSVVTGTSGAVTTADLTTAAPSASGNSLAFIDSVSQDSKGKITATKKNVTIDSALSSTSTNPVQNTKITEWINRILGTEGFTTGASSDANSYLGNVAMGNLGITNSIYTSKIYAYSDDEANADLKWDSSTATVEQLALYQMGKNLSPSIYTGAPGETIRIDISTTTYNYLRGIGFYVSVKDATSGATTAANAHLKEGTTEYQAYRVSTSGSWYVSVMPASNIRSASLYIVPSDNNTKITVFGIRAISSGYNSDTVALPGTSYATEKLKTARQLAVSLSNTSTTTTFDGSANVTNIKTTGTLGIANGGTGATTKKAAEFAICGNMTQATAAMADNFQFVFSRVGSDQNATNGVFIYRTASTIWDYMKGKIKADSHCLDSDDAIDIWNSI